MKLTRRQDGILSQAIATYGADKQMEMMIEECAELIQALQKLKRKPTDSGVKDHVCEELADVEILVRQMRRIFDGDRIDNWCEMKIDRLEDRLSKHEPM